MLSTSLASVKRSVSGYKTSRRNQANPIAKSAKMKVDLKQYNKRLKKKMLARKWRIRITFLVLCRLSGDTGVRRGVRS